MRWLLAALLGATSTFGIPAAARVPIGYVTNNGDSGPGSLRSVLAACPDTVTFGFTDFDIYIASTLVVDCPHPVHIVGPASAARATVAGTAGHTVGTADTPFTAIVQPGITIINVGGGDGLLVRSPYVTIDTLGARGTTAPGFADIAVRSTHDVALHDVVLGLDTLNGLSSPPFTYRTGSALLLALASANVSMVDSAAGWNVRYWGAVIFATVTGGSFQRSAIVGASGGQPPVDTQDALSMSYGTSDFTVREAYITDVSSSSAVEMHTADRVTITDSTFARVGRAGVTVADARDITIRGVRIEDAGTCGAHADDGGIVIYDLSARVTVADSLVATRCGRPQFSRL